ncbi:hypothetical protein DL96DRAFT_1583264 [Flagelloscypha sp. PMI_526]|nr:hypothetical protein DL96DRAFT_1583264 [Flagelloscypha sp. PMI_526]
MSIGRVPHPSLEPEDTHSTEGTSAAAFSTSALDAANTTQPPSVQSSASAAVNQEMFETGVLTPNTVRTVIGSIVAFEAALVLLVAGLFLYFRRRESRGKHRARKPHRYRTTSIVFTTFNGTEGYSVEDEEDMASSYVPYSSESDRATPVSPPFGARSPSTPSSTSALMHRPPILPHPFARDYSKDPS